jgi:acetyl esterase
VLDRASGGVQGGPVQTPMDIEDGASGNGHGPSSVARRFLDGNGPGPEMYEVRDLADPANATTLARLLVPVARPRATVVYFHSGGWLSDSVPDAEPIARRLAERTACAFAVVAYRARDAQGKTLARADALRWWNRLVGDDADQRASSRPAVVMGLGHGARLCCEISATADADPLMRRPLLQILVDPVLRDSSEVAGAKGAGIDAHIRHAVRAAEARYGLGEFDFRPNTAPALVITSDSLAQPDADAYVSMLRSSGVLAELRVHQGQMHGFFEAVEIRQGERAFQQVVRTLRSICSRSERLEGAATLPLDDLLAHA